MAKNSDNGKEVIFDLEVNYNLDYNQVEVIANLEALEHIRDVIQDLIDNGKSGSHYEYDQVLGLEGNVSLLVIARR